MSHAVFPRKLLPVLAVVALPVVLLAAFVVAPGCEKKITGVNDHDLPPPPSAYVEQSSAANVLANLQTAYQKENFDEYEKLFSQDYVFLFNPADVGDPDNPTPQQWFRADDMDATRSLFSNDRVEYITLSWVLRDAEPSDEVIPGSWKVRVDAVNLDVHTRNASEIWIYEVKGAVQVFYFREDPTYTYPNGKHRWYCIRWDDSPIRGFAGLGAVDAKVEQTTWGQIKAHYHP